MRTSTIAALTHIHPNTVRLYETWHFISPVPRKENGYREYSELHLKQIKIARLAFKQEFVQNNLRKKATEIVQYSGHEQFKKSIQAATSYLAFLQTEYEFALQAIQTVEQNLHVAPCSAQTFSHQEAAATLQLTEGTLRNWERNGLYSVERNKQNRRIYRESDIQKLLIIRTLRSAHFSLTSISHLFSKLNETNEILNIHDLLQSTSFTSEFFHVTDDLLNQLNIAMNNVKQIITILKELQ
ncbi:MerR family transcriptional regulator [Alkalihalobacillus pseudalcaliphilus]|uniref:MerR family transcriptional regulator n=1 Tax=Alkalihalobacillus pseudalcaliphilus TaxID=79884 RepID=UPI00064D9D4A|nr:MerR family transcriptional regulator [Alkalihalobacillus pseudalcaliphilus]KMK74968.1 hypothetical protein AB990_15945 [Alkalihalobacillus pseudalcaliphilus]